MEIGDITPSSMDKIKSFILYIWSFILMFFYSLIYAIPTNREEDNDNTNNRQQRRNYQPDRRSQQSQRGRYRSVGGG
jgi:hypothetical protein